MTFEMWITIGLLAGAILLFVTEWLQVDLVALGVVIGLMVTEILTPDEALAGFSSPIVITVAALFIVGGAVMETGLAETIMPDSICHPKVVNIISATVNFIFFGMSMTCFNSFSSRAISI